MTRTRALAVLTVALTAHSVISAEPDLSKLPPAATTADLTFAKDIRPMLEASCFRCHGAERQKGQLRLDSLEAVLKGGKEGKDVLPGNSLKSPLVIAVAQIDSETAMPPKRGGRGGPGGPPRGPQDQQHPQDPAIGAPPAVPAATPAVQPTTPDKPAEPKDEHGPAPGGPNGMGGPGGPRGFGGPGGGRGGPPSKPLTAEQVGILRAWIDQGAK